MSNGVIASKVKDYYRQIISQPPCNSNRASQLGDPCLRRLVYERTRWQEKLLHDERLEMVFTQGKHMEEHAIDEIKKAGFKVYEQQRAFIWDKYNITGHIDAVIEIPPNIIAPLEIKSINHNDFEKINAVEDFFTLAKTGHFWLSNYPAQITIYMLMKETEVGIIYLKDKSNYNIKDIWVQLDYDYAETLIQKAEAIEKHVKENTLPERIDFNENICQACGYRHICLPDTNFTPLEISISEPLEQLIDRWFELKDYVKEYEEIDEEINRLTKGQKLMVGKYLIQWKHYKRKSYEVPDDIKKQYIKEVEYERKYIIKL